MIEPDLAERNQAVAQLRSPSVVDDGVVDGPPEITLEPSTRSTASSGSPARARRSIHGSRPGEPLHGWDAEDLQF